jgi:hypothetical protein
LTSNFQIITFLIHKSKKKNLDPITISVYGN